MNKKQLTDQVMNDPLFKSVVAKMTPEQRGPSTHFIEKFLSDFYDALIPGLTSIASNPSQIEELRKGAEAGASVVMPEAPAADAKPKE